jgi:hypothetical protein
MAATYEPIATTTLGSNQANVTFSTISGSYTDLVLICSVSLASLTDRGLLFQVNGDTGTNYSLTNLDGNGSSAASGRDTNNTFGMAGLASSANVTTSITHFMNYSNTTTYKTMLARGNNSGYLVRASVSLWRNTAAITSIKIFDSTVNLASGSTFTLYGIKAA